MHSADFRELLESLNGLTPRQRETLLSALERRQEEEVHEVVAELFENGVHCPHCGAERVIRWGQTSGLPRWRCKECRRTFTPLTGTPLARLRRRDRWADFAESLRRGETLREAAERCGIHINTAHRWRHRFLKGSAQTQARLVGIAEADETFVLRSAKGQPELRKQWGRPPGSGAPWRSGPGAVTRNASPCGSPGTAAGPPSPRSPSAWIPHPSSP